MKKQIAILVLLLTSCQPSQQPNQNSINKTQDVPPGCKSIGQTWTSPVDGMTLMCVPAGPFLMGAAESDTKALAVERPQHTVTLDAFWIDRTDVTNRQFQLFIASTGYQTVAEKEGVGYVWDGYHETQITGASWKQPKGPGGGLTGRLDHPVVQVSWNDAQTYCAWAGRSLPTEAEWEKAARGTDGQMYPWGKDDPGPNLLNFNQNINDTTPVGKYSPQGDSPYGVQDMAGNVWQWVADWYQDTYYASSPFSNPKVPTSGQFRVNRGGAYIYPSSLVRLSLRHSVPPDFRNQEIGFRCAR